MEAVGAERIYLYGGRNYMCARACPGARHAAARATGEWLGPLRVAGGDAGARAHRPRRGRRARRRVRRGGGLLSSGLSTNDCVLLDVVGAERGDDRARATARARAARARGGARASARRARRARARAALDPRPRPALPRLP